LDLAAADERQKALQAGAVETLRAFGTVHNKVE
jgi:hypothetical protein